MTDISKNQILQKIYNLAELIEKIEAGEDNTKAVVKTAEIMLEAEKFVDALIWCSGSADFGPEGQAHEGWKKICEPLLNSQKPA